MAAETMAGMVRLKPSAATAVVGKVLPMNMLRTTKMLMLAVHAVSASDRKLTKAEMILAMRRDDGQLAALLGLPSPVVSSMDEHREFNEMFAALDCQRGTRSVVTFDEFHEYVDGQFKLRVAAAQKQLALAVACVGGLGLLLLAYCYQARSHKRREHDKSS